MLVLAGDQLSADARRLFIRPATNGKRMMLPAKTWMRLLAYARRTKHPFKPVEAQKLDGCFELPSRRC